MPTIEALKPPAGRTSPGSHAGPLSPGERETLATGAFMSRLPASLVDAILARVRIRRLAHGEPVLRVGESVEHWMGIASGCALVHIHVAHLPAPQCMNWAPSGVWFNLYNPLALATSDVDARAEGPTVIAALDSSDLRCLVERFPELSRELAIANAGNLRRSMQLLVASQRATLRQRQLSWLIETVAQHPDSGLGGMSQEALARWHGVSRQAWCEGMKALEQEGLVHRTGHGLKTADVQALQAAMEAETRAVESPYAAAGTAVETSAGPIEAPPGPPAALALRTAERERLSCGRWFASLAQPLQDDLLESGRVWRVAAGETVQRANEAAGGAWLLIQGAIRLESPLAPPPNRALALLPPGSWHGLHDLVYRSPGVLDAVAHEGSTLLWLPAKDFHRLFDACLHFRLAMVRTLAFQHAQAVRYSTSFFWPVEARVGIWLHLMHRYFDLQSAEGSRLAASFTLEAVAQWVGTTRQAVSRQFKQLEQQGVIARGRDALEVLKPDLLPQLLPGRSS